VRFQIADFRLQIGFQISGHQTPHSEFCNPI
jgi:hypothetical protein